MKNEKVEYSMLTFILVIFLLTLFVGCEAPQEGEEEVAPVVTLVDAETEEVIIAETPEEVKELVLIEVGDYKSACVDGEVYLIEIKESWNGERLDVSTESYAHNDCYTDINDPSTYATLNVETVTAEEFYGEHLIIKDGNNYNIDGVEFVKQ